MELVHLNIVYSQKWLLDYIYSEVSKVQYLITNTDKLEKMIFKSLADYLSKDSRNVNHKKYLKRIVAMKINEAKKKFGKQQATHFSDMIAEGDDGEEIMYEPIDVLANVESVLEIEEAIVLLAKGDRKRNLILNSWRNGSTNDSELSDTLASVFGGQARSHCKFIQRFRTECQANYIAEAV